MNTLPEWLVPGARVWHGQVELVVAVVDEHGLVLETRRRGYLPVRRLLNLQEVAAVLASGALRPFVTTTRAKQ